jgi:hypothetical protein
MKNASVAETLSRLVPLLALLASLPAHAGGDSTKGGGFAFSRSSDVLLTQSIEMTLGTFSRVDPVCLNRVLEQRGLPTVNLEEVARLIRETRRSYMKEASRVNPEGAEEPLVFDYGTDAKGKYIEALKIFFIGYMTYNPSYPGDNQKRLQNMVGDMLLHEASHHFGYNELQARAFRRLLSNQIGCQYELVRVGCYKTNMTPKETAKFLAQAPHLTCD